MKRYVWMIGLCLAAFLVMAGCKKEEVVPAEEVAPAAEEMKQEAGEAVPAHPAEEVEAPESAPETKQ
jgi:PBP1b-binding outer membrane lipoprotein LpoB